MLGTPTAEGNQLWFYEAGLDVPLDVWTDSDLTIPWAQPITLNAAAEADGPIYVTPDVSQKIVYKDANGVPIAGYPVDFVAPSTIINVNTFIDVPLTNAQILTLPTTAVTVVAAPAAGLYVKVLGGSITIDPTAGAYNNIDATFCGAFALGWGHIATKPQATVAALINDSSLATPLTKATDVLHTAVAKGTVQYVVPNFYAYSGGATSGTPSWAFGPDYVATSDLSGVALQISTDNNGSGNWTGGNAANTANVRIYYALESLV